MSDKKVQDCFWRVNGYMSEFFNKLGINDRLNESQLLNVSSRLFGELKEKFSLQKNLPDIDYFMRGAPSMSIFYRILRYKSWEERYKIVMDQAILNLLHEEFKTIEDESLRSTCRIYTSRE